MDGFQGVHDVEVLVNLEDDLERMVSTILVTHLYYIPLHMQRYMASSRSRFSLLKNVAQEIVCYTNHHNDD